MQSHPISVFDSETNETRIYPSLGEAARVIGVSHACISNAFRRKKGESTV